MKATYSARFGFAEKKTPILWLKYTLNKVTLFYLMPVISAMYGKVWQKSGISGKSGILCIQVIF